MKYLLINLVKFYQISLSPILGNQCKFSPTCSCYAIETINKHGALKGTLFAMKRIFRCNPWSNHSGLDPVD